MPTMQETMNVIHKHAPHFVAKNALILGYGLGSVADSLTRTITIPYQAIPGLHGTDVVGHASLLVLGYLNEIPIICLKGRLHLYEGVSFESIKTLVRMIKLLGAQNFIVTCSAGSLNPNLKPGEIAMITDHINFYPGNPLIGPNDETFGPRFLNLENAYDADLRLQFEEVARKQAIPISSGIYVSVQGPSYETVAESKMMQQWGGDMVGMSVVPEVIVARHCGLNVIGLAAITNMAPGISTEKFAPEQAPQHEQMTSRKLTKLLPNFIQTLSN